MNKFVNLYTNNWLLKLTFAVLLALLTALLLMEMAPAPPSWPFKDKVQHLVAFGGVATVGLWAFSSRPRWLLIGLCGYGAWMEVLQGVLTLTRQASVLDWLADNAGILLAWGFVTILNRWWEKHGRRI